MTVLHVAPEGNLGAFLKRSKNLFYVTADLHGESVMVRMDLCTLGFAPSSFDAVICSHVLEHVADDRRAISEIYKALKPGGWAILQVPISISIAQTDEDPSVVTPSERQTRFGQADHVRLYGTDFKNRLTDVGFELRMYSFAEEYGEKTARKYGLIQNEKLFVCWKPE